MFYLHLIHYIGFFGAQTFNSILALLIIKRAGRLFGAYRHVMLFFTLCSMWFSWVEILTQPVMHTKGSMFAVFIDNVDFPPELGELILCLHCASFAFLISVFAAQFFYRYCALCKLSIMNLLTGYRIYLIFLPCFMVYFFWFKVSEWGTMSTSEKREYLKDDLEVMFDRDSESIPFVAVLYWTIGPDGRKIWRFKDLLSAGMYVFIINTVSSMILFFALKIYFHMRTACTHMSQKTLDLNRQLFIMLTVQTIVPFVLMYIPIGLVIGLPFFNLNLGEFVNLASASIAIYPMIEPLIAMFCITDFRWTVFQILGIRKYSARVYTISDGTNAATQPSRAY